MQFAEQRKTTDGCSHADSVWTAAKRSDEEEHENRREMLCSYLSEYSWLQHNGVLTALLRLITLMCYYRIKVVISKFCVLCLCLFIMVFKTVEKILQLQMFLNLFQYMQYINYVNSAVDEHNTQLYYCISLNVSISTSKALINVDN